MVPGYSSSTARIRRCTTCTSSWSKRRSPAPWSSSRPMSSIGTMSGRPVGLGHAVRDVDAEAVDAAVQPEPHRLLEVGDHLGVGEVQVRLLRREEVQVPLPVRHAASTPGRRRPTASCSAARCRPARGPSRNKYRARSGEPGAAASAALEPVVLVRAVVRHQVDRHPDAERVGLGEQGVELGQVAEDRLDVARIGDVVAVVGHRRGVERRDPEGVHAEVGEVRQPAADAGQVTDAVAVAVGEAADVDLVEDRVPPPVGRGGQGG